MTNEWNQFPAATGPRQKIARKRPAIIGQPEEPVEAPPLPDITEMSTTDLQSHPSVQQYAQEMGMSVEELVKALSSTTRG